MIWVYIVLVLALLAGAGYVGFRYGRYFQTKAQKVLDELKGAAGKQ